MRLDPVTQLQDLVGKTIEQVIRDTTYGTIAVRFSDKTYTIFGVEISYEPGDEEILIGGIDMYSLTDSKEVELGLITQEELEERKKAEQEALAEANRERHYRQYLKLKEIFEK